MNIQADKTSVATAQAVDIRRILKMIPHRYPMVMVDRVIDMQLDHSAVGIKNVSINEPHFAGHFPTRPIMPGVMIVESMAQTAAVLVALTESDLEGQGKLVYFLSIENARFRKPVVPGDTVHFKVKLANKRPPVWKYWAEAHVEGKKLAEAEIGAMLMDERGG